MSKGNRRSLNSNMWFVHSELFGDYTYVLVPTNEGLFRGLNAIRETPGGDLEVANRMLLSDALAAVENNVSVNRLNAVQAYRIVLGLAEHDELAEQSGLSVEDFASHPSAMVRQTVAVSSPSDELKGRLLTDPDLSVQYAAAVSSHWDRFSEAQIEIGGEVLIEILLNPDCSDRAAELAMASYSWAPSRVAAAFAWDKLSEDIQEEWREDEALWGQIARAGKMTVWSCETVQASTTTYRNDWQDWFSVFGAMYMNISDAFAEFQMSRSNNVQKVGG